MYTLIIVTTILILGDPASTSTETQKFTNITDSTRCYNLGKAYLQLGGGEAGWMDGGKKIFYRDFVCEEQK